MYYLNVIVGPYSKEQWSQGLYQKLNVEYIRARVLQPVLSACKSRRSLTIRRPGKV